MKEQLAEGLEAARQSSEQKEFELSQAMAAMGEQAAKLLSMQAAQADSDAEREAHETLQQVHLCWYGMRFGLGSTCVPWAWDQPIFGYMEYG